MSTFTLVTINVIGNGNLGHVWPDVRIDSEIRSYDDPVTTAEIMCFMDVFTYGTTFADTGHDHFSDLMPLSDACHAIVIAATAAYKARTGITSQEHATNYAIDTFRGDCDRARYACDRSGDNF